MSTAQLDQFHAGNFLFKTVHKYLFTDALNSLNYTLAFRLAKALSTASGDKIRCLMPICRNTDKELEWRKAMTINTVIHILNAGGTLDCIPDACDCDEFAECICQELMYPALDAAVVGTPGSSGIMNPQDCLLTSNALVNAASFELSFKGAIADSQDFYDYTADETAALAAFALLGFTTLTIVEFHLDTAEANDRIGEAGVDTTLKRFLYTGTKTIGQTVEVHFTFRGTP